MESLDDETAHYEYIGINSKYLVAAQTPLLVTLPL